MTVQAQGEAIRAFSVVASAVLGLLVGSFLNVVAYRTPRGMSLVRPGSACPTCGRAIRSYDNLPVVSWIMLRGRCRHCKSAISIRYPLVEAATGASFALLGAWFTFAGHLRANAAAGATPTGQGPAASLLALLGMCAIAATLISMVAISTQGDRAPWTVPVTGTLIGLALTGAAAALYNSALLPVQGPAGSQAEIAWAVPAGLLQGWIAPIAGASVGALLWLLASAVFGWSRLGDSSEMGGLLPGGVLLALAGPLGTGIGAGTMILVAAAATLAARGRAEHQLAGSALAIAAGCASALIVAALHPGRW